MGSIAMQKNRAIDMTEGSIARCLILFALPVMFGTLFQKLYNTVDAWVLGNYVSDEAFSSVGAVTPIINMMINAFQGFAGGTTAVVARYCGARDREEAQTAVHTAAAMTMILAVAFTIVGVLVTPAMLRMTKTPDDVYPEALQYLTIYFSGIGAMLIYNMGAAILRAAGDTKRPSMFLVISSLVNVALDLILVLAFDMGVAGVAWATVISQVVSAVMVITALCRADPLIRLYPGKLRMQGKMLRLIVGISIPASIQFAITSFSNVFVQSYINVFGKYCMGGWTAFQKVDSFVTIPFNAVAAAVATFVGQNLGAGQPERAKKGVRVALRLGIAAAVFTASLTVFFPAPLVAFFNDSADVIHYGTVFIRIITSAQIIHCVLQIHTSALRGAGNTRVPMIIVLSTFVGFRQCYLHVVSRLMPHAIIPIAAAYPVAWVLAAVILLTYYYRVGLEKAPANKALY